MKNLIGGLIAVTVLMTGCTTVSNQTDTVREPTMVSDQYYWTGSGGNLGMWIAVKFNSRDEMADMLSLKSPVGLWEGKTWVLADILISLNCNGNGDVADWHISGPKPLIRSYVRRLEELYQTGKVFYDFYYNEVNVKPTAYWETEEE